VLSRAGRTSFDHHSDLDSAQIADSKAHTYLRQKVVTWRGAGFRGESSGEERSDSLYQVGQREDEITVFEDCV
jgi:hypothetical protein